MRKTVLFIHRYMGLLFGLTLLLSSVTGAAIVFAKPIDAWLNAGLLHVIPQQEHAPLDDMIAGVRQAVPGHAVSFVFVPQATDRAWEFWFHGDEHLRAYADPYTAQVLGTRDVTSSLMGFLVDLHIHLLSGETGERMLGWSGLGAIVLSLFGLYLWWPSRRRWKQALSVKWHAAPIRVWLDIHKVLGVAMCLLIMLTAATGSALALHDVITEPLLKAFTGEGTRQPAPRSRTATAPDAPLGPMLQQVRAYFPTGRLSRLALPADPRGAVVVRLRLDGEIHQFGRTFLWFDRYDGSLLKASSAFEANLATRIQNWFYPLHTGFYGGTLTRGLQVLVGMSLATLVLSGAWLWWQGWRARRTAAGRRAHTTDLLDDRA